MNYQTQKKLKLNNESEAELKLESSTMKDSSKNIQNQNQIDRFQKKLLISDSSCKFISPKMPFQFQKI